MVDARGVRKAAILATDKTEFDVENKMNRMKAMILGLMSLALAIGAWSSSNSPLKLVHTTPLPELKEGDFDHFAVDLTGNRLFSTAEDNSKVLVFDLKTNELIYTISDLKAPHSMLFRGDLKKLFVVDGDLGVKIYETQSYKPAGSIEVRKGADSSAYDPSTKYLYVVTGGKDAKLPNAYITVLDSSSGKQVADIKMDSERVEAMAFEKSGPRMFVDVRGNNTVEVIDREKRTVIATWSIAEVAQQPTTIAFDEPDHRLFVGTRDPGKLIVLDSDSGKVITSLPAAAKVDDMPYDIQHKRIFYCGTEFTDVFEQRDADHYDNVAHIPTAPRAKTAILVPELNNLYLAVPQHEKQPAELRVYSVMP